MTLPILIVAELNQGRNDDIHNEDELAPNEDSWFGPFGSRASRVYS